MRLRHLFLAALVGCATVPARYVPSASVVVENGHWLEQVVYADCGTRIRIGVARGIGTTTLRLPAACLDRSISFVVDPIGSNELSRSDATSVLQGESVHLQVPAYSNGYIFLSKRHEP